MIAHQIGPIASALVPNLTGIFTPVTLTIVNPGAENGTTSWARSSTSLLVVASGTNATPRTETQMFSSGTASSGSWSQTIPIPVEAYYGVDNFAYQLSVNRYVNCNVTGQGVSYLQFDFKDASGNIFNRVMTNGRSGTQATWTLLNEKIVVPPGTRTIVFYLWMTTPNATSNKVYVDDLSASLIQVANTAKVDLASSVAIFGTSLSRLVVRDAIAYPVFGSSLSRLVVRDAVSYFIVKP